MCFGTFDLFHEGHLAYFRQARAYGDSLVVVVARDNNVEQIKGRKPLRNEQERLWHVSNCGLVNKVILGHDHDFLQVIEEEQPDVLCLGYDQAVDEEHLATSLEERGLKPLILRMEAYHPEMYKSSLLKKQLS